MAAIACVNSGAGLVTVATDRENITALHAHLPEAMAFDLRETERFLENLRAADVVLIGSGLGEDGVASQAMDLVLANIRQIKIWLLMVQLSIFWLRRIRRATRLSPYSHPTSKRMGTLVWF